MMNIHIFVDAGCNNHKTGTRPGEMGIGYWGYVSEHPDIRLEGYHHFGFGNSMIAEWMAAVKGFELAYKMAVVLNSHGHVPKHIFIKGDSQVVVNQYNGIFAIKGDFNAYYAACKKIAMRLRASFGTIVIYQHVLREENSYADELSQKGKEMPPERFSLMKIPEI